MADKLSDQQRDAVYNRGGKLLVSAAAGSGKTFVLVERLLSYILDEHADKPINIDDFLIITYTKAAASELRAKIAKAISKRLAADPGNVRLQQQFQRLYLAKVSTVHSFCGDILREHAYLLDIPGDFRMIEEREDKPLRDQVLAEVLKDAYANITEDPDFMAFVDTQGVGRGDADLPELILKVYNSAKCHMDPDKWLQQCVDHAAVGSFTDAGETVWGKYLIGQLFACIDGNLAPMKKMADTCAVTRGLQKTEAILRQIIDQMEDIRKCSTWDEIHARRQIDYGNLNGASRVKDKDPEVYEMAKHIRDFCKSDLDAQLVDFSQNSAVILQELQEIEPAVRGLAGVVRKFAEKYDAVKRKMRVMDFSDLEHKALDLLVGKDRSGPTAVARKIGQRYHEIMVDEYQDSNEVQDSIFGALTAQRDNLFMVGDVKQSIYQFRLADPSIFLKKYNDYAFAGKEKPGEGRKILLSSNYRSSEGVIEAVNAVFTDCMTPDVGGLFYGKEEALEEGIKKGPLQETAVELHALDAASERYTEEAELTADRICELLDGTHTVRDGDVFRPVEPDDIVILLHSPKTNAETYIEALQKRGLRVATDRSVDLLGTEEVQWLRNFLHAINNPRQDIPLAASICGPVFGIRAEDLAMIRGGHRHESLYESLCRSDHPVAVKFISILNQLRSAAVICSLPELIERIFLMTRADSVYAAMDDGVIKSSNLQDFYQFIVNYCGSSGADLQQVLSYLQQSEDEGLKVSRQNKTKGCIQLTSIHKSKGLEYPIVFLCALSKRMNLKDTYKTLLSHKELGFGLSCVDQVNRTRYPSLAKRAIARKMVANVVSEEMRVLYVAMTRPVDRLIMMFSTKNLATYLYKLALKMDFQDKDYIISSSRSIGNWIMYSALKRLESGKLFALGGYTPSETSVSQIPWVVRCHSTSEMLHTRVMETAVDDRKPGLDAQSVSKLGRSLSFRYGYAASTKFPSKQTATQKKGRSKDDEVSANAGNRFEKIRKWREPSFIRSTRDPAAKGNAYHKVMKFLDLSVCDRVEGIKLDLLRLKDSGLISEDEYSMLEPDRLYHFFCGDLGTRLRASDKVIREFKFSVLEDAAAYDPALADEKVLLQGVVDSAFFEEDGIVVLDYKTDFVTEESVGEAVDRYREQVKAYADALSRIYCAPVKESYLYFFRLGKAFAV